MIEQPLLLGREHLNKFMDPITPLELSWSQITAMNRCKYKWYMDYIMRYRKLMWTSPKGVRGKKFHKYVEDGINDLKIIDGEVDLYGGFIDEIPSKYLKGLYWIEDFMQKWWETNKDNGWTFEMLTAEREIRSSIENYRDIYFYRYGFVDLEWKIGDGYFLWDIKTGNFNESNWRRALRQLYYYRSIYESWGMHVVGIAAVYPFEGRVIQRVDESVPRDVEDKSRLSTSSINSVENTIEKALDRIMDEPIEAEYAEWFCIQYCNYSSIDLHICDMQPEQDVINLPVVNTREELLEAFS